MDVREFSFETADDVKYPLVPGVEVQFTWHSKPNLGIKLRVLGKNGVESIPPMPALSDYEQKVLDDMRETLQGNIKKGLEFANS